MNKYTLEEVTNSVNSLFNPFQNKTLGELDAVKHVGINDEKKLVILIVAIATLGGEEEKYLRRALAKLIKLDMEFDGIKIQFEQCKLIPCANAKFILIESGKGGVGKSQIAVNLAYRLANMGKKVGLIDGDIYTPSINTMLGIPNHSLSVNDYGKIRPLEVNGFEMISVEFFNQPDEAVLWNGQLVNNMLSNFLYQVAWNKDIEFMIIDMPSDTSDYIVNAKTLLPNSEVILVTTPTFVSSHSVIKAANACKQLNQNVIGIVENMKGFPVSDDEDKYLNESGGKVVSNSTGLELLCSIPFKPAKKGYLYQDDEENGQIINDLATLISIR